MIDKRELERMIEREDTRAEKYYRDYQETGVSRYDTQRRKAEDLAEALRAALNAADEHAQLIALRGQLVWWANEADKLLDGQLAAPVESMLRSVVAYAAATAHYKPKERDHAEV